MAKKKAVKKTAKKTAKKTVRKKKSISRKKRTKVSSRRTQIKTIEKHGTTTGPVMSVEKGDQDPPQSAISRLIDAAKISPYKDSNLKAFVSEVLAESVGGQEEIFKKYNLLIFFDEGKLMRSDADKFYRAISTLEKDKPVLLILHSPGGQIEPAYLMSKLCRDYSNKEFHIAVPRRAKSAATLLACGADRIHMGSLSELGPIDPQIGGLPVLALKNALGDIAKMSKDVPEAGDMLASYLSKVLKLEQLGYYERVAESAAQYAERLLAARHLPAIRNNTEIAQDLVYKYKDHGFVIDNIEARDVFGDKTVIVDSDEYRLADSVYIQLDFIKFIVRHFAKRDMYYIGTMSEGLYTFACRDK